MSLDEINTFHTPSTNNEGVAGQINDTTPIDEYIYVDDQLFIRNEAVTIRDETDEGEKHLLYVPDDQSVLLINNIGKNILELCNGTRSALDIAESLEKDYEIEDNVDVKYVVKNFLKILAMTKIIFPRQSEGAN